MHAVQFRLTMLLIATAAFAATANVALAQKAYDPGATDTEIRIGNIMPYSGPVSAYSVIGRTEAAYFKKVNDEGGINGRKINFISYDDAYSPPKTVEQARKLVERDEVLLIFNPLGTPTNSAIQKYMNAKKVPQLFVSSGATKWNDPKAFPWTMGWQPNYQSEARIYAKYILQKKPNAKIAVLYQNDDYGKDYLKGFKDGLGVRAASMIVAEEGYEISEPTIDGHVVKMKSTNADVFFNVASAKFAAQAIKKIAEIQWKPLHFLSRSSASIGSVIGPAGFEHAQGIISAAYSKDPNDPQWKDDVGMQEYNKFLDRYFPGANRSDTLVMDGYSFAQTMEYVLKQCGDNLTRENIMRKAANIEGLELGSLLPGIKISTSASDFAPIKQMQLERLQGEAWQRFGEVMTVEVGG